MSFGSSITIHPTPIAGNEDGLHLAKSGGSISGGFEYLSLSDYLKKIYKEEKGDDPSDPVTRKREYQEFGDSKRKESGDNGFFAKLAVANTGPMPLAKNGEKCEGLAAFDP